MLPMHRKQMVLRKRLFGCNRTKIIEVQCVLDAMGVISKAMCGYGIQVNRRNAGKNTGDIGNADLEDFESLSFSRPQRHHR